MSAGGSASSSGGGGSSSNNNNNNNNKRYYANVQEFMQGNKVDKGCDFTHTSLSSPALSFYVQAHDLSTFYSLYALGVENNQDLHVTEKTRHIGPCVVDFDFRYQVASGTHRRHTPEQTRELARLYVQACSEFLVLPVPCRVYVMERDAPYVFKDTTVKDGIHFVLPEVVTRVSIKLLIRDRFIELATPLIQSIGSDNKVHDIVDLAVINKANWMMHGSRKPGAELYKVTQLLVLEELPTPPDAQAPVVLALSESDAHRRQKNKDLVQILSIRNKYVELDVSPLNKRKVQEAEEAEERKRRKAQEANVMFSKAKNEHKNTAADVDQVRKLVKILDPKKAGSYDPWIKVGWCLRNIDYRLLDAWIDFSRQGGGKFEEGKCEHLWDHMKDGGLGTGTLHMWAKQDNPEAYQQVMRDDLRGLLLASLSGTHYDVAQVVYHMFKHQFVCASVRNRCWYEFRNHRWHESDAGIGLRLHISDTVWREYNLAAIAQTQAAMAETGERRDTLDGQAKKLKELASKLRITSFKENVLKECSELFYQPKFEEKLDSTQTLIGFENGIFDLENMEFRDGRPEDFVSFTTGINYIEYDPTHPTVHAINTYFEQVHTNPALREYTLKLFATFLSGHNKEQKFYVWTGAGSNGKSLTIELFERTMGDYCCKFPITLLTQKRAASNAATSELARAKGKRLGCLQEPSEDEKLNIGLMKELSGGDKIMARAIYKEPIEFKPQFKMVLLCNHLPSVPSEDGGTWRRIRVVEWGSRFCDSPKESHEFLVDYDLPQKMEHWREHFMSILLQYYRRYTMEGITEPQEVLKCTMEYKAQNDHIALYLLNRVDKTENGFLSLDDIFADFRDWVKADGINMYKLPSKSDLEKYLSKNMCKPVTRHQVKGFKGWALKALQGGMDQSAAEPADAIDA